MEPRIYCSTRKGLLLTVRPDTNEWDERSRKYVNKAGKNIKFEDGRFVATDEEEVEFLENFIKQFPDEVTSISERNRQMLKKLQDEVKQEEAIKAEAVIRKQGGQGAFSSGRGKKVQPEVPKE